MYSYLYFLDAKEKPKGMTFQSFPKSVTVQDKESVEIECEILGKPTNGKSWHYYMSNMYNITFVLSDHFVKKVRLHLTSFHMDVVWFTLNEITFIAVIELHVRVPIVIFLGHDRQWYQLVWHAMLSCIGATKP